MNLSLKMFWALLVARNKEFYRDRGAFAWNVFFPVLVILGFWMAYSSGDPAQYTVAWLGKAPTASGQLTTGATGPSSWGLTSFGGQKTLKVVEYSTQQEALLKLKRNQVDLVVNSKASPPEYWVGTDSPKGQVLERWLTAELTAAQNTRPPAFVRNTLEGKESRYIDWLLPGLLAMNVMFSSLYGVGYTIVSYRKGGYLRRLKATPVTATHYLAAQVVSRLLINLVGTVAVYAGLNSIVHFQMEGSYFDLLAIVVLGSLCMISVGLVIAARTASEELANGVLNLIASPMMFLSGVWFSLEGMNPWILKLSKVLPLTHIIEAARRIMNEGATLSQLVAPLSIMMIFTLVMFTIGVSLFKWDPS